MSKSIVKTEKMSCRLGCGACCIAPSISSAIPGMPEGKAAGQRCVQLDDNNLCRLFSQPTRPQACLQFQACVSVCGDNRQQALANIQYLEVLTVG